MEIPNLDCMDISEVRAFATVARRLMTYAETKAEAMACRASGNVSRAVSLEAECDAIWRVLPAWARW